MVGVSGDESGKTISLYLAMPEEAKIYQQLG